MVELLFAAVNARYNHTNLAVRSITGYVKKHWSSCFPGDRLPAVSFGEWTINQPVLDILRGIAEQQPRIVLFSVYIWNVKIVLSLIPELPKILPDCIIMAGGPEAGYRAEQLLSSVPELDAVICGEGEQTCLELAHLYTVSASGGWSGRKQDFLLQAASVAGMCVSGRKLDAGDLCARSENSSRPSVRYGGVRQALPDLGVLPFPYPEITDPDNRIYYYESSRGCPFSCAYCLSSTERSVRFMPLDRVFADVQRFLDAHVRLVKFVDRTYNLEPGRYIAIWRYIVSHHNGYTMFHFEIEAEYLNREALAFIQSVPSGVMQFEIGVQSTNPETLRAVGRSAEIEILFANIRKIPATIHKHLDLIAGLPFEDLESFGRSFDAVLSLCPDVLQLGFLKVLFGTSMAGYAVEHGWKWMQSAPYEVLSTPFLPYGDVLFLKDIEVLLDVFYNSGSFRAVMEYVGGNGSLWSFFSSFVCWCRKCHLLAVPHTVAGWFEYADEYFKTGSRYRILHELLRFDFLRTGKKGSFPTWCEHHYIKTAHRTALEQYSDVRGSRIAYALSEYDTFSVNPLEPDRSESGRRYAVLFLYSPREKAEKDTRVILLRNEDAVSEQSGN